MVFTIYLSIYIFEQDGPLFVRYLPTIYWLVVLIFINIYTGRFMAGLQVVQSFGMVGVVWDYLNKQTNRHTQKGHILLIFGPDHSEFGFPLQYDQDLQVSTLFIHPNSKQKEYYLLAKENSEKLDKRTPNTQLNGNSSFALKDI